MAQINDAAVQRLNADPATTKSIQRQLGLPETGVWDNTTDSAMAQFQTSQGRDVNFGLNGDSNQWSGLNAALAQRAPDPTNPAMQDPAYAAYLRTMGVQQANITNEIQNRTEAVQRAINRNAAGFEQQKAVGEKQVGLNFEDRGLYSSGARQDEQAKTGAGVDFARQQSEANQTDALSAANRQSTDSLATLAQQRVEQERAARDRLGAQNRSQTYNPTAPLPGTGTN